jgi:hypothetical protein
VLALEADITFSSVQIWNLAVAYLFPAT